MWDDLDTPWVGRALLALVGVGALGAALAGLLPFARHDLVPVEAVPGFFVIFGLTVALGLGLGAAALGRALVAPRGSDDA